jgi:GNAT superfamily N-acetyltransferase
MKGLNVGLDLRDMRVADRADFLALWRQYLAFYHVDLSDIVTQSTWSRLMDATHAMTGRVAVLDGIVVGFAIHMHHASTWVAGDDCYLEDLFVTDAARGHGVGRALIDDLIAMARTKGWHRVYWHTDEANTRARALYDQYTPSDGHIRYRLRL